MSTFDFSARVVFFGFFCLFPRKIVGIVAPPFAGAEEALNDKQCAIECCAFQRGKSSFIKGQAVCHISGLFSPSGSFELSTNYN